VTLLARCTRSYDRRHMLQMGVARAAHGAARHEARVLILKDRWVASLLRRSNGR
jgi:hypothetical protein